MLLKLHYVMFAVSEDLEDVSCLWSHSSFVFWRDVCPAFHSASASCIGSPAQPSSVQLLKDSRREREDCLELGKHQKIKKSVTSFVILFDWWKQDVI